IADFERKETRARLGLGRSLLVRRGAGLLGRGDLAVQFGRLLAYAPLRRVPRRGRLLYFTLLPPEQHAASDAPEEEQESQPGTDSVHRVRARTGSAGPGCCTGS